MAKQYKSKVKFEIHITPTWADCSKEDLLKVYSKLPLPKGHYLQEKVFFEIEEPKFVRHSIKIDGLIKTELEGDRVDRLVMGLTQKLMRFVQKRGFQFKIDLDYK